MVILTATLPLYVPITSPRAFYLACMQEVLFMGLSYYTRTCNKRRQSRLSSRDTLFVGFLPAFG